MAQGEKGFIKSQEKAKLRTNVDSLDFIKKDNRILYRSTCLNCIRDLGYRSLKHSKNKYCLKCNPVIGKYERSYGS